MGKVELILPQFQRDIQKCNSYIIEIADLPEIKNILVFPDVILKKKYVEAKYKCSVPSGLAIVTADNAVYPQLRSRGIGCGMIAFRTGLAASDENIKRLEKVFKIIRSRRSVRNKILRKARLDKYIAAKRGISGWQGWPKALSNGIVEYLTTNFGAEKAKGPITRFEAEGNHLKKDVQYQQYYADEWLNRENNKVRNTLIEAIFAGNHFLELQRVDGSSAEASDLKNNIELAANELVIMAHLGGGSLEHLLRQDIVAKNIYLDYYKPIYKSDILYEVIKEAIGILKNLGAIERATLFIKIKDAMREIFSPDIADNLKPVSECTHNDIDFDSVSGSIIYRHNLAKLNNGGLTIVSGRNDHPSYLVSPGTSSHECFNSIDHGIGEYLLSHEKVNSDVLTKKLLPGRYTPWAFKELSIPHFKDSRGDELLKAYKDAGILREVIRLVPILSLKG